MSGWRVVGASVQGTSHKATKTVCQDTHDWDVTPEDYLVIAVADGAGSAEYADEGAAIAARAGLDSLRWQIVYNPLDPATLSGRVSLETLFLPNVLKAAREALEQEALKRKIALREFATTLLVVAVTPQAVLAAQIGDGAVVIQEAGGDVLALTQPHGGEHANETTFLTAPEALQAATATVWQGQATHLAVFSDGLQRLALKLPEGTPHAPFFAPLFRFVEDATDPEAAQAQLVTFLNSPRIAERTDDDLTLVLAHRSG